MSKHADTLTKYFKLETSTEFRWKCLCEVEQMITTLEIAVSAEENNGLRKSLTKVDY